MSIISRLTGQNQHAPIDPNKLSYEELEFLLNCLKGITIPGIQVELFYNLVIKLQNQYVEQQSK